MEKFTIEQAFEAADEGEPIMLTRENALRIIESHSAEFDADLSIHESYDAAAVLGWLGY